MKMLPLAEDLYSLVVRTDFDNQAAWETICELLRRPVIAGNREYFAHLTFLEDREFRDADPVTLLDRAPKGEVFFFVVDSVTLHHPEFPVLVVYVDDGRTFRAIPSEIAAIGTNLCIANMSFFEFADNVDSDGIFRGFKKP
jgi:hypothetical protein